VPASRAVASRCPVLGAPGVHQSPFVGVLLVRLVIGANRVLLGKSRANPPEGGMVRASSLHVTDYLPMGATHLVSRRSRHGAATRRSGRCVPK
jgi:hypothetical protein